MIVFVVFLKDLAVVAVAGFYKVGSVVILVPFFLVD